MHPLADIVRIRTSAATAGEEEAAFLRGLGGQVRSVAQRREADRELLLFEFEPCGAGSWYGTDEGVLNAGHELLLAIRSLPGPTIGVIRGDVHGPLFEVSLGLRVRIAVNNSRLGFRRTPGGIPVALAGGISSLALLAGPARARRLLLRGTDWPVEELAAAGCIDRIASAEALGEALEDEVGSIRERSQLAQGLLAEVLRAGGGLSQAAALARERALFSLAFAGDDVKEGVRAFFEKRAPRFGTGPGGKENEPRT